MTWLRSWRKWLKWLREERCFGFQRLCNEPSKIEWLKTTIIYPQFCSLGSAWQKRPVSAPHGIYWLDLHNSLHICLARQLVLTRCHPLSKWPFHVASVGVLPSWWLQSAQTFHTVASFPQMQEQKFPDLLSIWAHTSQNVISTTFYQSKQSQGQPSSRGGHSTGHEYQEAWLAGATGKRNCDKQFAQKFRCGNQ